MKRIIAILFIFCFICTNAFAQEVSEVCKLTFYQNGESREIEKSYDQIAPYLDRIMLNSYDAGLNILMDETSVNDMKNVGEHLEITFEAPRIFKQKASHMDFLAYRTYIVKDNKDINSLPVKKLFLTYQPVSVKKRGIGRNLNNPKIINFEQPRIRIITGSDEGYNGAPQFGFYVDEDYNYLTGLFESPKNVCPIDE